MRINKFLIIQSIFFFLLLAVPASSADNKSGKVVILFDQSASMKDYDPKLISKVWLITFINTFEKPYDITFAGFDDVIHEHIRMVTKNKEDVITITKKAEEIKAKGLTTDLEVPLRYLLERNDIDPILFAIIVSDGEPEIWDEKRWYLSRKIRSDPRYEDLNRQYRSLKSQGISPRGIYDKLYSLYEARNLKLIRERLAMIKEKLGNKLVFLDISGEFEFFKDWAKTANAEYIMIPAVSEKSPVDALRTSMISLQEKASKVVQEPLPEDHERIIDPILEAESGSPPKAALPETPLFEAKSPVETLITTRPVEAPQEEAAERPVQVPPGKKEKVEKEKPVKLDNKRQILVVLLLFAAVFILAILWIFKKPEHKNAGKGTDELVAEKRPDIEDVRKRLKELARSSIEDAIKYIDNEVKKVISDADKARLEMLEAELGLRKPERRFSLRIPVPPRAMQVYWTDKQGVRREGSAINISMHGVMFKAHRFDADGIDYIKCPYLNLDFDVERSRIEKRGPDFAVALLDEFKDNVNAGMKWVEILTRIEEEL